MTVILILGSGPDAARARAQSRAGVDALVAINNAFALRPDWDVMIHPFDFPQDRLPQSLAPGQSIVTEVDFVPAQNAYGGFVYGGATMAFTAGYWALHHFHPRILAYLGCDMHYPSTGPTHFYGTGTADPLRDDITLRSLEAKSARLMVLAARQGCAAVNLSAGPSRLAFPRRSGDDYRDARPAPFVHAIADAALARESGLGYVVASGRYWESDLRIDPQALDGLDAMWMAAAGLAPQATTPLA